MEILHIRTLQALLLEGGRTCSHMHRSRLHMVCHAYAQLKTHKILCRFESTVHSADIASGARLPILCCLNESSCGEQASNGRHEAGACGAWAGWAPWAEIGACLKTDGRPQHCRPRSTECHAAAQKLHITSEVCLSLPRGAFAYIEAGQISAAPYTARPVVKSRDSKHQPFLLVRTILSEGHLPHR